jgi:hypothetical protein
LEIAAFVSRRRRLIAALAAVPLAAGVVMGGLAARGGPTYRAELVVAVPSSGETASSRLQAMTDFRELIGTDAVADTVEGSLTARQLGLSGLVTVRLDSASRSDVVEDVEAATAKALDLLLGGDRAVAEGGVAAADAQIADLTGRLDAVAAQAGYPLPRERYEAVLSELSQLRVTRAEHVAAGESGPAEALDASIAALEAEEARLAPTVAQADVLASELDAAREARTTAAQQMVVSQNRLDAAMAGLGDPTGPTRVSRRPAVLKAVATALVLGTIVAALLVALVELLDGERPGPGAHRTNGSGARTEAPEQVSSPTR